MGISICPSRLMEVITNGSWGKSARTSLSLRPASGTPAWIEKVCTSTAPPASSWASVAPGALMILRM